MRAWRICKAVHSATAFTGEGSLLYAGRWHHPGPVELQDIGTRWAESRKTVCLAVPSAVVLGERNLLLSPRHPDFARLTIGDPEPFEFDERLVGP